MNCVCATDSGAVTLEMFLRYSLVNGLYVTHLGGVP